VLGFLLWRSQAAIEFASAHIQGNAEAKYRVSGVVRNAVNGKPVPWPVIHDEFDGKVYFQGSGKFDGSFEFTTITAPHAVRVTAFGFRHGTVRVGKPWFTWLPAGSEKVDVRLMPE
jgi:hypothetical protein